MTQLFSNNASATLAATISLSDTSITVEANKADLFPIVQDVDDWFKATIEDTEGNIEIIKVTSRSPGSPVMTVARGQEGTTARGFSSGNAVVECRLTAADIEATIAHPSVTVGAHPASAISVTTISGMTGVGNVQDGLEYLKSAIGTGGAGGAYLPLAGGQMSGPIILHTDTPTGAREAVGKKYVDDKFDETGGLNPALFVRTDVPEVQAIISDLQGDRFVAREGVVQIYGYGASQTHSRLEMQYQNSTRYIEHIDGALNFVGFTTITQDGNPFGSGGQFTNWNNKIENNQSFSAYDLQGYSVGAYKIHAQVTIGTGHPGGWTGTPKTVDLYFMCITPGETVSSALKKDTGITVLFNNATTTQTASKYVFDSIQFVDNVTSVTLGWTRGDEIGGTGNYNYVYYEASALIKNIWKLW